MDLSSGTGQNVGNWVVLNPKLNEKRTVMNRMAMGAFQGILTLEMLRP